MSASTASTRKGFGRTAKRLVLGAMIACVGVFAFAGPAKAAPFTMDLTNGQLNLGFAFKGATILPAPARFQPTRSEHRPPTPSRCLTSGMPGRSFSEPGLFGGTPVSFKPAGCATPVTFGVYAAVNLDSWRAAGPVPRRIRAGSKAKRSGQWRPPREPACECRSG